MADTPECIKGAVRVVLEALVEKQYDQLVRITSGVRLSADEIAQGISEYGRTLGDPGADVEERLEVVLVEGSEPPRWSVVFPLWTIEEGWSDLSVELTVIQAQDGGVVIELDDIHVL